MAICPLLRLISWNLTTLCLAVTGGGNVDDYGRLSKGFWAHYNIVYLLTHL